MNKTDIVEIMQRKTTKLAVLSVAFVGMMVFLVPALIDEADARINAKATSLVGPFINPEVKLFAGKFWTSPRQPLPNVVTWETWGGPPFGGGSERGQFIAQIKSGIFTDVVGADFSNPRLGGGGNTCTPFSSGPNVSCHITSGLYSSLTITVGTPRVQENNNSYCDILDNLGGIDQSKVIREKLRC